MLRKLRPWDPASGVVMEHWSSVEQNSPFFAGISCFGVRTSITLAEKKITVADLTTLILWFRDFFFFFFNASQKFPFWTQLSSLYPCALTCVKFISEYVFEDKGGLGPSDPMSFVWTPWENSHYALLKIFLWGAGSKVPPLKCSGSPPFQVGVTLGTHVAKQFCLWCKFHPDLTPCGRENLRVPATLPSLAPPLTRASPSSTLVNSGKMMVGNSSVLQAAIWTNGYPAESLFLSLNQGQRGLILVQ